MADETLQLLKAFIEASGYEIREMPLTLMDGSQLHEYGMTYTVTKKKAKPRAQAKESGYSEAFEHIWSVYPKGNKGSKQAAYRQYLLRLSEVDNEHDYADVIEDGVMAYKRLIIATDQYIQHMSTFLGRDKHYLNDFTIPDSVKRQNRVKQEWEKLPENDNHLMGFAKKHGFKINGQDSVFDSRRKLQQQIRERIEAE